MPEVKRYFAESTLGDRSTMREYTLDELGDRDGGGDELDYDAGSDAFTYALGSGVGPTKTVPNPVPGDPVAGARLVADRADRDWGI
jgi:hypothetical protein